MRINYYLTKSNYILSLIKNYIFYNNRNKKIT